MEDLREGRGRGLKVLWATWELMMDEDLLELLVVVARCESSGISRARTDLVLRSTSRDKRRKATKSAFESIE